MLSHPYTISTRIHVSCFWGCLANAPCNSRDRKLFDFFIYLARENNWQSMDSTATIVLVIALFIIMIGMGLSLIVYDFKLKFPPGSICRFS